MESIARLSVFLYRDYNLINYSHKLSDTMFIAIQISDTHPPSPFFVLLSIWSAVSSPGIGIEARTFWSELFSNYCKGMNGYDAA